MAAKAARQSAMVGGVTCRAALKTAYDDAYFKEYRRMLSEKKGAVRSPESLVIGATMKQMRLSGAAESDVQKERNRFWSEVLRRRGGQVKRVGLSEAAKKAKAWVRHLRITGVSDRVFLTKEYSRVYENNRPESQLLKRKVRAADRWRRDALRLRLKQPHYYRDYLRLKRLTNKSFVLITRLRSRARRLISCKRPKTDEMIGCSSEFFVKWMRSHFQPGMTFDNAALWHIDHVFPLYACQNEEDILKAFLYYNLKPTWNADNIKKGWKITDDGLVAAYLCGITTIAIKRRFQISDSLSAMAERLGFTVSNLQRHAN